MKYVTIKAKSLEEKIIDYFLNDVEDWMWNDYPLKEFVKDLINKFHITKDQAKKLIDKYYDIKDSDYMIKYLKQDFNKILNNRDK